jgi:hypothetical protein
MDTYRRTFDDPYGKHALVYGEDDYPAFGRTDVLHIIPWRMHPTRVRSNYLPRHGR